MNWDWFNTGAGAASIVGLIVTIGSVISGWHLKRLQADIHASTQSPLIGMRKGFTESQQAIAQAVSHLGDILERMDQRADERHREPTRHRGVEATMIECTDILSLCDRFEAYLKPLDIHILRQRYAGDDGE